MDISGVGALGRVVSPAAVQPGDLPLTFVVGQNLVGTVLRLGLNGDALVNFNGQNVLLALGQQLVPGQTVVATVAQVSPVLALELADNPALAVPVETTLPLAPAPQEGPQSVLTTAQLKEYLAASQPFGQTITVLAELLTSQPLLHAIAPELTQALRDTLAVLQPQGEGPPDATQLQEQVDKSGINYESKVQHALTGTSLSPTAELLPAAEPRPGLTALPETSLSPTAELLPAAEPRPGPAALPETSLSPTAELLPTAEPRPGPAALTKTLWSPIAELAKDLKGQLLELSHRLAQLPPTDTDTRSREAAPVLDQIKRAIDALEFQQLSNQFAPQEHHPLVLPLVHPFAAPSHTMQLSVHRDGGQEGRSSAEQEHYTVAFALDLTALGPLHIAATVHGSRVSATVQVEDPAVAEFLRAATPELAAQLQALGLQASVTYDVREHVAQDEVEPLPHALTRAVRLLDVTI